MASRVGVYWWDPRRNPRGLAWEARANRRAWLEMRSHGGRLLRNFGDELSARVVAEATGRATRWRTARKADVTAIGSVFEHVTAASGGGLIWGTGIREPGQAKAIGVSLDRSRVLAVRGSLTRDALDLASDTPLGDPGLLARAIFKARPRTNEVLVIPHFMVFNSRSITDVLRTATAEGAQILAPSATVDEVCTAIARARIVLTSSLHGLIVADAVGTPAQLVSFGPTEEPRFKFDDYESVYGATSNVVPFEGVLAAARLREIEERATMRTGLIDGRIDELVGALIVAAKKIG